MNIKKLKFHLFDGEGGDGGSSAGLGAEASAFLDSLGSGNKNAAASEPEAHVEYGKPSGNEAASQVGADDPQPQDIGAEFAELIGKGGKFHDVYGQHVADAIQNRFKNNADYQAQIGSYNQALAPLFAKYGLDPGDIEGIGNAIANDMDIYTNAAEEEGVSPQKYMEMLNLKIQAKQGQMMQEEYQRQQQRAQKYSQWEAEGMQLKQAFPNFDLGQELNNEKFAQMLDNGVSVQDAFAVVHLNEIMNGISRETSQAAQQNVVQNIQQRAARPVENGVRQAPAVVRKSDPSKLTNKDMDEIFRRVENGETVSF